MMSEINVTPFVDVMLVLLVIFMITAPLMHHGVDVQLPKESIAPTDVKDIPRVTLKSNKKIFWNKEEMSTLVELMRNVGGYLEEYKDGGVYLKADKTLDYGFVMHIMATLKRAGVQSIGMVTDPQNQ